MDPISLTAQYSSTVLLAVLPHISDFARQMELPTPLPMTTNQVSRYHVTPGKEPECAVVLTNGMTFNFFRGHMSFFSSPRSFTLTPPSSPRLTNLFGPLKLSKEEAIQFARTRIDKLGFTHKQTFTDTPPDVQMPAHVDTNTIPYYLFRWRNPFDAWAGEHRYSIEIEVDASRKTVTYLACTTRSLFRKLPDLDIKPPQSEPAVNPDFVRVILDQMLPLASDFSHSLGLPLKLPLTTNEVAHFDYQPQEKVVRLTMKDGYLLYFTHGYMRGFYAPDSFYPIHTFPPDRPRGNISDYVGKWRLSREEATELARAQLKKLGHSPEEFSAVQEPSTTVTKPVAEYIVPRYRFEWADNRRAGLVRSEVVVEVDANKGIIKSFEWFKGSLMRDLPKIEVQPFISTMANAKPKAKALGPYLGTPMQLRTNRKTRMPKPAGEPPQAVKPLSSADSEGLE